MCVWRATGERNELSVRGQERGMSEVCSTHRHPPLCGQGRGCCYIMMIIIDRGQSAQAVFANWCGMNCMNNDLWESVHQFLFRTFYKNKSKLSASLPQFDRRHPMISIIKSGSGCIEEC